MFESDATNNLWIYKYRPINLEAAAIPDDYEKKFNDYCKSREIPNLMFVGPAGTGKSTIAKILVSNIITDDVDVLYYNGSTKTGVDNIRDNVESFLMSAPMGESRVKIVYIDEADGLSSNAQGALRGVIDEMSSVGRFLFTLNDESKIIEPLHSRFQKFYFKAMSKSLITDYVNNILNCEQLSCPEKYIKILIDRCYPDARKITNYLQQSFTLDGKFSPIGGFDKIPFSDIMDRIVAAAKAGNQAESSSLMKSLISEISATDADYNSVYNAMFFEKNYPMWAKLIISEYYESNQNCPLQGMHFAACAIKIIKAGHDRIMLAKSSGTIQ